MDFIFQHRTLHALQQHSFIVEVWLLNCPAYSSELLQSESIWCIAKRKLQQRRSRTAEHVLESSVRQERDNVPLPAMVHIPTYKLICSIVNAILFAF